MPGAARIERSRLHPSSYGHLLAHVLRFGNGHIPYVLRSCRKAYVPLEACYGAAPEEFARDWLHAWFASVRATID